MTASAVVDRVGARRLVDLHHRRLVPAEAGAGGIALRAELDAGDVAQAHDRAGGAGADDDVAELLGASSSRPSRDERILQLGAFGRRAAPPTWPSDAWMFCGWIAAATSSAVMPSAAMRSGFIQTRIEYFEAPTTEASPTPGDARDRSRRCRW